MVWLRHFFGGHDGGFQPAVDIGFGQVEEFRGCEESGYMPVEVADAPIPEKEGFEHTIATGNGSIVPENEGKVGIMVTDGTAERFHGENDGGHFSRTRGTHRSDYAVREALRSSL